VCTWGGGCGGDGGGGGGDRSLHTHTPPTIAHDGVNDPPTPTHQQFPKKGGAHLVCAPRRCVDHTQIRRELGGVGG
jgi:hypothetical protein